VRYIVPKSIFLKTFFEFLLLSAPSKSISASQNSVSEFDSCDARLNRAPPPADSRTQLARTDPPGRYQQPHAHQPVLRPLVPRDTG